MAENIFDTINKNNSDTTNQASTDALANRRADTQNWSDASRQTYEKVHSETKKSS